MVCGSVECYNRSSPAASLETGKLLLSHTMTNTLSENNKLRNVQLQHCNTAVFLS